MPGGQSRPGEQKNSSCTVSDQQELHCFFYSFSHFLDLVHMSEMCCRKKENEETEVKGMAGRVVDVPKSRQNHRICKFWTASEGSGFLESLLFAIRRATFETVPGKGMRSRMQESLEVAETCRFPVGLKSGFINCREHHSVNSLATTIFNRDRKSKA